MRRHRSATSPLPLLPVVLAALICAQAAAAEDAIFVEGEGYKTYQDLGGMMIGREYCTSASGSQAADGIDVPGEWIRLNVTFSTGGWYEPFLAYQANDADTIGMRLTIASSPRGLEDLTSDFTVRGYGIG